MKAEAEKEIPAPRGQGRLADRRKGGGDVIVKAEHEQGLVDFGILRAQVVPPIGAVKRG